MISNLIINSIDKTNILNIDELEIADLNNVFIYFRNIYDEYGTIKKSFLEMVQEFYELNSSLTYKNIIIVPDEKNSASLLNDNLVYILWFAKDETSFFDKDKIREAHIWKNVEWGKRKKNYSDGGKDPSNVWIPTKDNGKGKITEHIDLKIEGSVDRIFTAFTENDSNTNWLYYENEINHETQKNIKKSLRFHSTMFLRKQENIVSKKEILKSNENIKFDDFENRIYFETSEKIDYFDDYFDLVVTSPPYWNLKDYFKEGQIGKETYDEYLHRLSKVWKECKRLMKPNATLWININIRKYKKQPYFIPSDYINQLKKIGFYYKEVVIWHKSSSIPTTKHNLSDKFEVFLVFSLSNEISFNYEEMLNFNEYKNDELKYGTIWNVNRKAGSIGKKYIHPAIFPTELIKRVILLSTNPNDLILDPFIGSGSSGIAAIETNRNFMGIEYNEEFYDLIKSRFISETNVTSELIKQIDNSMIFSKDITY